VTNRNHFVPVFIGPSSSLLDPKSLGRQVASHRSGEGLGGAFGGSGNLVAIGSPIKRDYLGASASP